MYTLKSILSNTGSERYRNVTLYRTSLRLYSCRPLARLPCLLRPSLTKQTSSTLVNEAMHPTLAAVITMERNPQDCLLTGDIPNKYLLGGFNHS